jgi:predicted CoA-binding protein
MRAREALDKKKWAVVGDVTNKSKYAFDIAEKLIEKEHVVYKVDPRGCEDPKVVQSLKDLPEKVDMVNLVVRSDKGIDIVKEMKELGLDHVFIQPGASSQEILDYCKDNDIEVIRGCVLAEYRSLFR